MEPASSMQNQSIPWEDLDASSQTDGGAVTDINHQRQDLRPQRLRGQASEAKSSSDWLQTHSLQSTQLCLSQPLSQGNNKAMPKIDGGFTRHLDINAGAVAEFHFKLYQAIELYHGRIRWLNQGSKKVFGVMKGWRVGVIIDCSDAACTGERLQELQRNLLTLIEEQLSTKEQLYLMSFGSETSCLWNGPRDVNPSSLQEAHGWVRQLRPMGSCDLIQALQRGLDLGCSQLDSLVIILGSSPDQTPDTIADYIEQRVRGQDLLVHTVAYCSSSPAAIRTVKRLADVTRGCYHIFSASLGVVDDSTDVDVLWREMKACRELLRQTEALLRQGHLDHMTVTMTEPQIPAEFGGLSLLPACPESANHSSPLCIKPSAAQSTCSTDWLRSHGLKAKRLGLYQLLSPNAYSPLKQFVPVLNKSVSSTVHERAMVQFEWHDGTIKNVHVDLPYLLNYQRELEAAVCVLERRVLWLSGGSRRVWGTLCEQRVQIIVDMSVMNCSLSLQIHSALRVLLEEQLASKHSFNITTFGSNVTVWRERMVPPTVENLQDAWRWLQGLKYSGGRNTLAALRQALEGILHEDSSPAGTSHPHLTQGLYLLTSGPPDQEMDVVCSYVSECCRDKALSLHVCLLTRDETDTQTAPLHANTEEMAESLRRLAQAGRGRFLWSNETGILESDDITALIGEMERAVGYWQKSFILVESLTQRASCTCPAEELSLGNSPPALTPQSARPREGSIPTPRPTALTLARLQARETKSGTSTQRSLTWRSSIAGAAMPPAQPISDRRPSGTKAKLKKKADVSQSVFYLEDGNFGVVFKSYPKPKSVRKSIPSVTLPKQEDICSSKQWLKSYGIRKMKLGLHRLVSGPDCTHHKTPVPSALKTVSAKYCSIFPSVHINGAVRHLQLTPGELRQYLAQSHRLLQRYIHRLHWLLTDSRRVFGTVLEREVCILVDVSGSMAPCLGELKRELSSLIWDQLHRNNIRFSLLAFSGEVRVWRPALQESCEEECRNAVQWVSQLDTHGGTNTLEALKTSCGLFGDRVGLYVLSDGKPDCSCSMVLRETKILTTERHITIHTVSYNCTDSVANDFLKKLAHQNGGRYHRCHDDADMLITGLLSSGLGDGDGPELPDFEGDDLRRLAQEINKLKMFQKQAQAFRDIIMKRTQEAT